MNKEEIRTYTDACDWYMEHGVVNVNSTPTPIQNLEEWVDALRLIRQDVPEFEVECGAIQGTPDELIAFLERDLPLNVIRVEWAKVLGKWNPQTGTIT